MPPTLKSVRVRRITVQYEGAQGKLFAVDLDPDKVQAVVLSESFLQPAQQITLGSDQQRSIRPVIADQGIPPGTTGVRDGSASGRTGSTASSAVLWWRDDEGVWIHPGTQS